METHSVAELETAIRTALQAGDWPTAARLLGQLEPQRAADYKYWMQLANAQRLSGAGVQALTNLRKAHAIAGDSPRVLTAMAELLCQLGARVQASQWIDRARLAEPENVNVRYVQVLILIERFELTDAVYELRELLDRCPRHEQALSALLYLLNLLDQADPKAIAEEHCRRATACYGSALAHKRAVQTGAAARGKIRVGFISADFRDHPVGRFAQPLLEHLDRDRFELYGYSSSDQTDQLGSQIRSQFTQHSSVAKDTDDRLERRLRSDGLDMLIDLSGHTAGQRMRALARRPVPVQIQWLGYPNTSGLSAFDYRILDSELAPIDEQIHGSEKILRLPDSFACFRPPQDSRQLAERDRETLVLASPHRLEKLSDSVVSLWASVLRDHPQAKLLLVRDQIDAPRRAALNQRFSKYGVGSEQLIYRQQIGPDYWSIYGQFDLLLDCFPWTGHTLACESLWMGVPVVTLRGVSVAGRLTASALSAAGMHDCIADNHLSYRRIVAGLIKQPPSRTQLRQQLISSKLCDERSFATNFGGQLETIHASGL